MAINFPNSPAVNDVYLDYKWDGEKWILRYGGTAMPATTPPTILTGLKGWWDASVTASLTLSGSNITAVADQSGQGNHMGPYSTAPTYNATGFNTTYPAMMFVGSGGSSTPSLKMNSFPLGTGVSLTVFIVGTMDTSTCASTGRAMSYFAGGSNDTDNDASFMFARNFGFIGTCIVRNSVNATGGFSGGSSPYKFRGIATIDAAGQVKMYMDGVLTQTGGTLNAAFGATGTLSLGTAAHVAGLGGQWGGCIAECGIATGPTNSTAVAALDTYLKNKWGL